MNYTTINLNPEPDGIGILCHEWCTQRIPDGCMAIKPIDYLAWFCIFMGMSLGIYDNKIMRGYGIAFIVVGLCFYLIGWNL